MKLVCTKSIYSFKESEIYDNIEEVKILNSKGYIEYAFKYNDTLYTSDVIEEYFMRLTDIYQIHELWVTDGISTPIVKTYTFSDKDLSKEAFEYRYASIKRELENNSLIDSDALIVKTEKDYVEIYSDEIYVKIELVEDVLLEDAIQLTNII